MTLSIITLTFNNYSELIATYNSISDLVDVEYEWVVINGGNCPKTQIFLKNITDSRVKFLSEKDNGIYDAFNKGINLSSGEFIVFLNSGDLLISKTYFKEVLNEFKKFSDIVFCHSNIIFIDSSVGELIFRHDKNKHISEGMPFFHQTLVVRKNIFNDIGFFDTSFKISGDYDWVMRMILEGYKGKYFDVVSILMDGRGISSTNELKSIKECYRSLIKNKNLGPRSFYGISFRLLKYLIRNFLYKVGGEKVLKLLKKNKYVSSK